MRAVLPIALLVCGCVTLEFVETPDVAPVEDVAEVEASDAPEPDVADETPAPDEGEEVVVVAPPDGDEDGVRDEWDRCPGVADAQQANSDHDDLGDACDPCPTVPGSADCEAELLFESEGAVEYEGPLDAVTFEAWGTDLGEAPVASLGDAVEIEFSGAPRCKFYPGGKERVVAADPIDGFGTGWRHIGCVWGLQGGAFFAVVVDGVVRAAKPIDPSLGELTTSGMVTLHAGASRARFEAAARLPGDHDLDGLADAIDPCPMHSTVDAPKIVPLTGEAWPECATYEGLTCPEAGCDDENACTRDSCVGGLCRIEPDLAANGAPCSRLTPDDGVCLDGVCTRTVPSEFSFDELPAGHSWFGQLHVTDDVSCDGDPNPWFGRGCVLHVESLVVHAGAKLEARTGFAKADGPWRRCEPTTGHGGVHAKLGGHVEGDKECLAPYGSADRPLSLGGPAVEDAAGPGVIAGVAGGGAIAVISRSFVLVDGEIDASGQVGDPKSGGAGGSVLIVAPGGVSGIGAIRANGGDADDYGGSGGYIRIQGPALDLPAVDALGGVGDDGDGEDGTIKLD